MVEVCFRYMPKQPVPDVSADCLRGARSAKPTWSKSFDLIRYELSRIGAESVVVEAGYQPAQVRADGWPYSNAVPEHHQIRLSFKREGVAVSFFQGVFVGGAAVAYNAWLIGMTLQALRAVERYGCTKSGQQYAGWAQLPPGTGRGPIVSSGFATVEDAARFLLRTAKLREVDAANVVSSPDTLQMVYRAAAKLAHPDVPGGSAQKFSEVSSAKEMVEASQLQAA